MNDLAMLKATRISVSMENSPRSLKAVSTFVCPLAAQNGLALAFRQLELICSQVNIDHRHMVIYGGIQVIPSLMMRFRGWIT